MSASPGVAKEGTLSANCDIHSAIRTVRFTSDSGHLTQEPSFQDGFVMGYDVVGQSISSAMANGLRFSDRGADMAVISRTHYRALRDRWTCVPAGVDAAKAAARPILSGRPHTGSCIAAQV
jgi:hypothetical protein